MNLITDIPNDELECFKKNVKDWLAAEEKISELNKQIKEPRKAKNKLLNLKLPHL